MKIWHGYGSEHSMNLVMIGHFKDALAASAAKEILERLKKHVDGEQARGEMDTFGSTSRFSDASRSLLDALRLYSLKPVELEQLAYEMRVEQDGTQLKLRTDESDFSAFMNVMLSKGARIEVFSAHDHPDPDAESNE